MRQRALALLTVGLLLFSQISAIASETDGSLIEETYNAWVRAVNAKDIEWWSTYLAPNALFLPPGVQPLETEEAILEYYRQSFADPHFALDCQQLAVDVAQSGEMAWARGVCRVTFTSSDGQVANGNSRWLKVWLKQDDGSWKCRVNTWNYEGE
jgi:uncharacterized protein (TIGR02246 family)